MRHVGEELQRHRRRRPVRSVRSDGSRAYAVTVARRLVGGAGVGLSRPFSWRRAQRRRLRPETRITDRS
ncbi:protein of unknown function [Burkholderia multivorans]